MRSCTCRRLVFFDVRVSIKNVLGRWSLVVRQNQDPRRQFVLANDQWPTTNDELLRSGFAHFLLQTFARITYTFILVRIGWTQAAHFGSDLSDFLAIDPGDAQLGLLWIYRRFNADRQRVLDQMRVAQTEHHRVLAFHFGA